MSEIKYQGRIDGWQVNGMKQIAGQLSDSQRPDVFPDGSDIVTSRIKELDSEEDYVITEAGSLYLLLRRAEDLPRENVGAAVNA